MLFKERKIVYIYQKSTTHIWNLGLLIVFNNRFLTLLKERAIVNSDGNINLLTIRTVVDTCISRHSFCEEATLKHLYLSGVGTYAHKNCKAIDFASAIQSVASSNSLPPSYHPLLVSVKNWANVTTRDAIGWLSTMMAFLGEIRGENGPTAVCLIILVGCKDPPSLAYDELNSLSLAPFPAADVFRLVCVDENDAFGVSAAIRKLGLSSEQSEIYSSHSFMVCEDSPDHLLRKSSQSQESFKELFKALNFSAETEQGSGWDLALLAFLAIVWIVCI